MADSQTLFDTLAGAFSPGGTGINRPALNAAVAGSQTLNGLRSAQTDEAWQTAEDKRVKQAALATLADKVQALGYKPEEAALIQAQAQGGVANSSDLFSSLTGGVDYAAHRDLANPALLGTPTQTGAQQTLEKKVAGPVTIPDQYTMLPGQTAPDVHVSPKGQAEINMDNAMGNLHQAQADVGGFNPHTASSQFGTNAAENAALATAVAEHRLDPTRINSRNAKMFASLEMNNPGFNYNRAHADAALQSNAGFQQKEMVMESIPHNIAYMASAGKKLNYPDAKFAGIAQQFLDGQINDPALAEYMPARMDTLLGLANVFRSVGMSDKTIQLENEAQAPTLSPRALDSWVKAQVALLSPRLNASMRVKYLGEKPGDIPDPVGDAARAFPDVAPALRAGQAAAAGGAAVAPATNGWGQATVVK